MRVNLKLSFLLLASAGLFSCEERVAQHRAALSVPQETHGNSENGASVATQSFGSNSRDVTQSPYLAPKDCRADAAPAINRAIQDTFAAGGGTVYFPQGCYRVNTPIRVPFDPSVLSPYTRSFKTVRLVGESKGTELLANNPEGVLHFGGSHGGVENFTINCGLNSVGRWGLKLSPPEDVNGGVNTTLSAQNYNRFSHLYIRNCTQGIRMQAGARINGADSGSWYNRFEDIQITASKTGITLLPALGGVGSQVNRNQFHGLRIGNYVTTGILILAGDTNQFFGASFEGIRGGADAGDVCGRYTSLRVNPYSEESMETLFNPDYPSAIKIAPFVPGTIAPNQHNVFISPKFESCFCDGIILARGSQLIAHNAGRDKLIGDVGTSLPDDPARNPLTLPGIVYPEGSAPGFVNGAWNFRTHIVLRGNKTIYDDPASDGSSKGAWQRFNFGVSHMPGAYAISGTIAKYQQISGTVDYFFRTTFRPMASDSDILIPLPVEPEYDAHRNQSFAAPQMYSIVVYDGAKAFPAVAVMTPGPTVNVGGILRTALRVPSPPGTGWHAGGVHNQLSIAIRYKAEGY